MSEENEIMEKEDNWSSWKIYVIKSLKRLESKQEELEREYHETEIQKQKDLTELKTKSKMTSAIVSAIVTLVFGLVINVTSAFLIYKYIDDKSEFTPKNKIEQKIRESGEER